MSMRLSAVRFVAVLAFLLQGGLAKAESESDGVERLKAGNQRYTAGTPAHPNQEAGRRAEVAQGQKPFAIVLTCSDSRVPPEMVFDQGLGDLFVVRTAGNVVDNVALGSLEYAAEHLKVPLLVVMGHTQCGAVKATVEGGHAPGHIYSVVEIIRPAVEAAKDKPGDPVNKVVRTNAELCAERLRECEPILKERVSEGHLKVVAACYDLQTGKVEFMGR